MLTLLAVAAPAAGIDTNTLYMIAIALIVIAIAASFGLLDRFLKKENTRITIWAPRGEKTKLIVPGFGLVTVIGLTQIGGKWLPITVEFGKDKPLPIDIKINENTFAVDDVENFVGTNFGKIYMHYPEGSSPETEALAKVQYFKKRSSGLLLENEFLKRTVEELKSQRNESFRKDTDVLADIKKKLGTQMNPDLAEKMRRQGNYNQGD